MRTILFALIAFLVPLGFTSAHTPADDFNKIFTEGIEALNAGRNDEGIEAFKRCLEISPNNPTCAYNVACGYAKKGEADAAFEWLDKSADWGFGNSDSNGDTNIVWAKNDVDLESLRADPRFEAYLAKMTKIREAMSTTHELEPAVYIPEALADAEKLPLLVVLHDQGGSASDGVSGRWKAAADELGMALLAPSALYANNGDIETGMTWFADFNSYQTKYWTFEKPVNAAVSAFKKEHDLDRSRVFIAGEGQGATVAFNVGMAGPGLYKGVVALNGAPLLPLADNRATQAAKLGFRARFIFDKAGIFGIPSREQLEAFQSQSLAGAFNQWNVEHAVANFETRAEESADEPSEDPVLPLLIAALSELATPAAEPVEAGVGAGEGEAGSGGGE